MGVQELLHTLRTLSMTAEMPRLIPVNQLQVNFAGERGGEGPLTFGQSNTLRWASAKDQYYRMIEWVLELPEGTTLDDVAAAFATLMTRHESLRTMYPADCGPVQRVAQSGTLAIDVYEVDGESGDGSMIATELVRRLRATEFDLATKPPLAVAVAVRAGVPVVAAIVYSHVAVDFASMAVIGAQFASLASNPPDQQAGPRGHQPLDQAVAERSARGEARSAAALRYWESQLRRKPQCLYAVPAGEPGPDGQLSGWLWSRAAALALPAIAARTGASRQMIVLAALCAVLARRTGQRHCAFLTRTSNRYERRLREYVGSLAHDTLISVDTGVPDFAGLVRQAGTATLRAARNGLINEAEVLRVAAEVDHDRGISYARDCVFNDLSTAYSARSQPAAAAPDPAGLARALEQTTVRWVNWAEVPQLLLFNLVQVDEELILGVLTASTQRIPRPEIELLLRGLELLLAAAASTDVDLDGIGEITGVEPVSRGPGWLQVDSCWIEVPQVQRLVDAAVGPAVARVFAVPDGPDRTTVVACLAGGSIRTPEQAHAACLRLLPGRHTAMAPGRYVICERPPADPGDLAAWLAGPALADGDGRGTRTADTAVVAASTR